MKIAVFSAKEYDRTFLQAANAGQHDLLFVDASLNRESVELANGATAVCVFVNDTVDAEVLTRLSELGVGIVTLRCAGFNNVDVLRAQELGIRVTRVPKYSPHAVAEHTVGLMLCLNRNIHRAFQRVREGDFRLDGLLGFDMHGKVAGVIGTGAIGECVVRILAGLGCEVICYDIAENPACVAAGAKYVSMEDVLSQSDVITLHCPLTPDTHHLIDAHSLESLKDGVMLINTGRGALVDTQAIIAGLKTGKIGALGLDVYEEEAALFFDDHSEEVIQDDIFARLLTFPNVLVTGHQAFFTEEALSNIAATTMESIGEFAAEKPLQHEVKLA